MGDQALSFQWTPGAGNGLPLDRQELDVALDAGFTSSVSLLTLSPTATTATATGLANDVLHYARVRGHHAVGDGPWSSFTQGTPSGGSSITTDPNPIPTETSVRYASSAGSGGGLSVGDPMSYTAGLNWIDDSAPVGGTLRLLGGTYNVSEFAFDNGRVLGVDSAYRVVRSHDLDNPAIINCSQAGYGGYRFEGGANRICLYGLEGDGNCTSATGSIPQTPPGADGAQQFIRLGNDSGDQNCHHIWIKQCKMHHFYTGGVTSVGQTATTHECFLVEDCQFWNNAHGPHWGGSGCSILYPKEGLGAGGAIDTMFKPTIDGSQRICGFIFRRNIGYRNYQVHETSGNTASDGNMVTTDFWNPDDYELGNPLWTPLNQDYNRACLIENNVSFGNGRLYAATYTHPRDGVWFRFNTSSHDGITYRHIESATSTEASPIGGRLAGGWNDVFRVDANLIVIDPAMANPNVVTAAICVDGYSGGATPGPPPTNPALRTDWNLFVLNAGYAVGAALAGHTNTVNTDPGLGTPPDYLTDNGEIPMATIQAWATPLAASSATQPSSPYVPSDGVDVFWNTRGAGSVGAVSPGGTSSPPPANGFKAVAQGLSGSGALAMPAEAVAGDTIVYVATRDPAGSGTVTAPVGGTVHTGGGGAGAIELYTWVDFAWNGTDVPGNFGDSGGFSERLIYVFDGTASGISSSPQVSSTGVTPTWPTAAITTAGSIIALVGTYDTTDKPYTKTDGTYTTNVSQGDWVGVTGMSKAATTGTHAPSPAGDFAGTGNMVALVLALEA